MIVSKRDLAAAIARRSGLTGLLASLPTRPSLLVLTYHRIGNADQCPYDPGTFSATCGELDEQVRFLKRRWHLVGLDEAIEIVEGKSKVKGAAVLLTFDDGYLDNYESAFPILSSHGVQGVFFLPVGYIGSNRIAWWDAIAYIVKHSRRREFELAYPAVHRFNIATEGVRPVIARVLGVYKSLDAADGERFIRILEEVCGAARPENAERCFMNWEEAEAMLRGGMAIGSHTQSHRILSKLPAEDQFQEMACSKQILEKRLGVPVRSIAYPVGLPDSFTPITRAAAERAQYRVAFSYYGGVNTPGAIERYNVLREPVDNAGVARFGLQTTLAVVTRKYWF
jgi:peptidoglycan/xylan/chitin deacetylase (PgdA/CDA1 family)